MADLSAPVKLIVLSLAVWRISYMLVWEDGPLFIFARWRHRLHVADGVVEDVGQPAWLFSVGSLFACIFCMSVWVSLFFFLAYNIDASITTACAVPFALSAGAILVQRYTHGESF